jgi:hypothetical protein
MAVAALGLGNQRWSAPWSRRDRGRRTTILLGCVGDTVPQAGSTMKSRSPPEAIQDVNPLASRYRAARSSAGSHTGESCAQGSGAGSRAGRCVGRVRVVLDPAAYASTSAHATCTTGWSGFLMELPGPWGWRQSAPGWSAGSAACSATVTWPVLRTKRAKSALAGAPPGSDGRSPSGTSRRRSRPSPDPAGCPARTSAWSSGSARSLPARRERILELGHDLVVGCESGCCDVELDHQGAMVADGRGDHPGPAGLDRPGRVVAQNMV